MSRHGIRRRWPLAACLSLLAGACAGDNGGTSPTPPGGPVPATVVVIGPDSMIQGQRVQFSATLLDSDGAPMSGKSFTWYSDDSSMAHVSQQGLVTAKKPGSSRIFATVKPLIGSAPIRISDAAIATHLPIPGRLIELVVSGNKGYLSAANSDTIVVLDVAAERVSGAIRTGSNVTSLIRNPDGSRAYFTTEDGKLGVIDLAVDSMIRMIPIAPSLNRPATSADGGTIWVMSGFFDRIYVVSAATFTVVDSAPIAGSSRSLTLHPGLNRLYVSDLGFGTVRELDPATFTVLRSWHLGGRPNGMVFSSDGARLIVANGQNWVDEIDLSSGAVSAPKPLPAGGNEIELSPGGDELAITSTYDQVFLLYSATRSVKQTVLTGGAPSGLAYRADGSRLLAANANGWVDFIR